MMRNYTVLGAIFLIIACPLYGQIVIEWDELPHVIGTHWTVNGADSVVVSLGSSGGPQNWDFTSQPMGSENTAVTIVPRLSTPFADSFPTADLVSHIVSGGDDLYNYAGIAPTYVCNLGLGSVSGADTTFLRFDPVDSVPLPLTYGNNRHYYYGFSNEIDSTTVLRTDDHGFETINAYGSIAIPYGSYECLRICYFDTIISTLYYMGSPIYVDTVTYIIHDFYTETYGLLAHVLSYPDETNPFFTQALFLERLTDFSSGVQEAAVHTENPITLCPNPFSGHVTLSYSLSRQSDVALDIYDINGRRVITLIDGPQSSGEHSVKWLASDYAGNRVSNGVYFYHFTINSAHSMGKLLLIE